MRKLTFSIVFLSLFTFTLLAKEGRIEHEYIIQLAVVNSVHLLNSSIKDKSIHIQLLNSELNYYLIKFDNKYSRTDELNFFKSRLYIISHHPNSNIFERSCKPNDPNFKDQWNFSFMGFEDVWCVNKNNINELGDTIAVGLIDYGFNYNLSELNENLYRNYKEIEDNQIDDDQNGYVDDYIGFNAIVNSGDDHDLDQNHGTNVLSLINAKGNNNVSITGSNQVIKVVLCSAKNLAQVVSCYSYFIKLKSDYLKSDGKKGAFIASTSISLGTEQFPDEAQGVCDMYDLMGNQGILSVCATVNKDTDIDKTGDIPSLCPSPYLITVTNTDRSDTRAEAGYSKISIDIGASGELVPVIAKDGSVVLSSGCSLSAPQVAGGIAYLNQYCLKYNLYTKSNPSEAALLMKSFIFSGSKDNLSLRNITSSGKRFDVNGSLNLLLSYCEILPKEDVLEIKPNPIVDNLIKYELKLRKFQDYEVEVYNTLGQSIYYKKERYSLSSSIVHELIISNFSIGVYYLVIRTSDNKFSRTFVKV